MPLEVLLRPGDYIYIGTAKIIVRSGDYTKLAIEGSMPVLRESDFVELGEHPSKARALYVMLQDSYMQGDFAGRQDEYTTRVADLIAATPGTSEVVASINSWIAKENLCKALKAARPLVEEFD